MLLLSTASLRGYGLHKIFTYAKKAGYDGLNLDLEKLNYDAWDAEYVKGLSDAFGIKVLSITAPDKGMDRTKVDRIIKIGLLLQTQVIVFSPPHITDKNSDWFTHYLAKKRRENNISLAIQNVQAKFWLFVIPEYKNNTLMEIKKITGDSALNIANIDKSTGVDIIKSLLILGSSIRNVFLSDRHGQKDLLLPGGAGGGVSYLPIESFLMKLRTNGYNGFITIKVRPSELGAGNNEKVLQNLEYMRKYYEKHYLHYKNEV